MMVAPVVYCLACGVEEAARVCAVPGGAHFLIVLKAFYFVYCLQRNPLVVV